MASHSTSDAPAPSECVKCGGLDGTHTLRSCAPAPAPSERINTTGCADPVPLKTYAEIWGEPNPSDLAALRSRVAVLEQALREIAKTTTTGEGMKLSRIAAAALAGEKGGK